MTTSGAYDADPRRPGTSDVYDDLRASKLDHLYLLDSVSPRRISNSASYHHDPTRYLAPPLPPPLLPNDGKTYFDFGRGRKGGKSNFSRSTPSDVRYLAMLNGFADFELTLLLSLLLIYCCCCNCCCFVVVVTAAACCCCC